MTVSEIHALWQQYKQTNFLKLINYALGNKPIAWPHLGHIDAPFYPRKEQMKWGVFNGYPYTPSGISKHVCLEIN